MGSGAGTVEHMTCHCDTLYQLLVISNVSSIPSSFPFGDLQGSDLDHSVSPCTPTPSNSHTVLNNSFAGETQEQDLTPNSDISALSQSWNVLSQM